MFTWLFRWLRMSRADSPLHFVLYTRAGCHLCEDAVVLLEKARRRHGFRLEIRDVDPDPDLVAAHGNCVPVVTVNGKVRFRGKVNPVLLDRLLRAGPSE